MRPRDPRKAAALGLHVAAMPGVMLIESVRQRTADLVRDLRPWRGEALVGDFLNRAPQAIRSTVHPAVTTAQPLSEIGRRPSAIDELHMSAEWDEFRRRQVLESHWTRPGWWTGREAYYWMIRFDDDEGVAQLAASCQELLRLPMLDLVPRRSLHLTLSRIGFADETEPAVARSGIDAARTRLRGTEPIPVRVGPLAGSGGAIRLIVTPRLAMTGLRDKTHEPTNGQREEFRPHVSIGYVNRQTAAAPLIDLVRDARQRLRSVLTTVNAIHLVRLRREEHRYELQTIDAVSLLPPPRDA